jgi:hypothetical protein
MYRDWARAGCSRRTRNIDRGFREKIGDLKEKGELDKVKKILSLPSLPSIHLPKIRFAAL